MKNLLLTLIHYFLTFLKIDNIVMKTSGITFYGSTIEDHRVNLGDTIVNWLLIIQRKKKYLFTVNCNS